MNSRSGKHSYNRYAERRQAVAHVPRSLSESRKGAPSSTIDEAAVLETVLAESESYATAAVEADEDGQELTVLARILIDAVKEERRHDKAN